MASFEHRSGAWRVRIIRRPLRIDESATFPTKAQAQAWATKREAEILAGARGLPSKHTVADAIDKFLKEVTPHRGSEKWERVRLNKFKRHKIALRTLSSLSSADMAQWRDERLREVSPASVAREMNQWGALFSVAVREWKWLQVSPVKGVRRPAEPPARRRGVTEAESSALVKALQGGPSGLQVAQAFLLSLETGMRCGEILGLTWDHVNLAERYVSLAKTKNGDSRAVPLSIAAVAILRERLVDLPQNAEVVGMPSGNVFTVTGPTLDVLFRRARDAAVKDCPSVHDLHFHDCRGQAIRNFVAKGLGVYEICSIVGHRDPKSIMFYFRVSASEIAPRLD